MTPKSRSPLAVHTTCTGNVQKMYLKNICPKTEMYVKNICHINQVPTMCTPLPCICPSRMLNGVQSINFFEKKMSLLKPLKLISFFQSVYIVCTRMYLGLHFVHLIHYSEHIVHVVCRTPAHAAPPSLGTTVRVKDTTELAAPDVYVD